MIEMRRLDSTAPDFWRQLDSVAAAEEPAGVEEEVRAIVTAVRERGDAALVELTNRLDERDVGDANELAPSSARSEPPSSRPRSAFVPFTSDSASVPGPTPRRTAPSWDSRSFPSTG